MNNNIRATLVVENESLVEAYRFLPKEYVALYIGLKGKYARMNYMLYKMPPWY